MAANTLTDKSMRVSVGEWIAEGMGLAGLNQSTLAERSGVARETIWRLLHGKTQASEWTLRRLAEAMGGGLPESIVPERARPAERTGTTGDPADGWLFGGAAEAEEQFLSFLRNIERTTRAMVGNPDLFAAEEHRVNQLAVCRTAMRSAELAGRPVPAWLTRIHNRIISGDFR